MKALFIMSTDDAETTYNAMRLANIAVKKGDEVSVFMVGRGVLFEKASNAELAPDRYRDTLAFMLESRYVMQPTQWALETELRQRDYIQCWNGIKKNFNV